MSFWHKNKNDTNKDFISSMEYDRLFRRNTELNAEIEAVKSQIKLIQTDVDNLRGNFNRKLKGLEKEEKTEELNKTQDIYSSNYIPMG